MHIRINEKEKRCEIWVPNCNSKTYKQSISYQSAVESNRKNGYSICVYVGGDLPLISVMDDFLNTPVRLSA